MLKSSLVAATAVAMIAGSASATLWSWTWDGSWSSVGVGGDPGVGLPVASSASYDDVSNLLHYDITYANQAANGIWAVINPGPYPAGVPGRDAILYMDGTGSDIHVNVLGYNASGDLATSHADGDHPDPGTQAPDRILASDTGSPAGWLHGASITDNIDGTRSFSFDIDTTAIDAHIPLYASASDWRGMGFNSLLGVWVHSVEGLTTSYDNDGWLTQWDFTGQTFFDEPNIDVPAPGTLALLAVGGLATRRRRR